MKKILSTVCMALIAVAMTAQSPVITFEKTEHDFGKVDENGKISTVFTFKNEGMAPLLLSNVRASCGCTTPIWPKEPIEPGQTGNITVQFNTNGRPGKFNKTVTITSNASEPTTRIYIKGEVIPKQAKPVNRYTIAVGDINMKGKLVDLGTIKKGESKSGELEYTNLKEGERQVDLATNDADSYLMSQVTLPAVKTNEVGKFVFFIDTKDTKLYGPVEAYAYVVVDGKKEIAEDFKLTVKANIVEDFANMTVEEKQQAPIIEILSAQNAGSAVAGKNIKFNFPIKNSGVNPLEIRRIYSTDNHLAIKQPKAIKSGKKGMVSLTINTNGLKPGNHSSEIVVISNDYQHPVQRVIVSYDIK